MQTNLTNNETNNTQPAYTMSGQDARPQKDNRPKKDMPCPYNDCDRLFTCQHNVDQHILEAHSDERPWVCSICANEGRIRAGKTAGTFKRPGCLNRHMEKSHGIKVSSKQGPRKSAVRKRRGVNTVPVLESAAEPATPVIAPGGSLPQQRPQVLQEAIQDFQQPPAYGFLSGAVYDQTPPDSSLPYQPFQPAQFNTETVPSDPFDDNLRQQIDQFLHPSPEQPVAPGSIDAGFEPNAVVDFNANLDPDTLFDFNTDMELDPLLDFNTVIEPTSLTDFDTVFDPASLPDFDPNTIPDPNTDFELFDFNMSEDGDVDISEGDVMELDNDLDELFPELRNQRR